MASVPERGPESGTPGTPPDLASNIAPNSVPNSGPKSVKDEPGPKFEEAMARLEQIVHALETGNLSLDESLRVFEEGTSLLRVCTRRLEETERRIEVLMRADGGVRTEPFRWDEESA